MAGLIEKERGSPDSRSIDEHGCSVSEWVYDTHKFSVQACESTVATLSVVNAQ